jgi:hypothetical protein
MADPPQVCHQKNVRFKKVVAYVADVADFIRQENKSITL